MKTWKKAAAVLTAATMVAGLAACGGGQNANAPAQETGVNPTGFPIVDEKITIKVMAPNWGNSKEYNEKSVIQDYEEKTNIHVEWTYFTGDASEKLSLAFAAKNNIPDAFLMSDLPSSTVDKYGTDGIIRPVEDLIEQHAPGIKAAMDAVPDAKKMSTSADGHMYAVPSLFRSKAEKVRGTTFINHAWLSKLGLEMPTTTDELYTVLKAFKDQDPNGNGQADEVPLMFRWDNNYSGISSLFGSWGVQSAYTGAGGSCMAGPFFIKNGKVTVSNMQEGYREAVKYFHKLYAEGLINVDTFTAETTAVTARLKMQPYTAGVCVTYTPTSINPDLEVATANYACLPPLAGPSGERHVFQSIYGIFANNYISTASKHPMAVIRWMDGTADPDISYEWNTGKRGKVYDKIDGKYQKLPVPEGVDEGAWKGDDIYQFPVMGITDNWLEDNVKPTKAESLRNSAVAAYEPFADMLTVEHLRYTEEERKTLEATLSQIVSYSKQKEAEWVTNGTIDAEWDAHLEQLKAMNIEGILKIMQAASDRWDAVE